MSVSNRAGEEGVDGVATDCGRPELREVGVREDWPVTKDAVELLVSVTSSSASIAAAMLILSVHFCTMVCF